MWRKPTEPKPSSQAPNTPAPAPVKEVAAEQSKSAGVSSAPSTAEKQPVAAANAAVAVATETPRAVAASPAAPTPAAAAPAKAPVFAAAPERRESAEPRSSSTINAGLKIRGEIFGDTDLFVDGQVEGKIRMANARVTVGPNGRVQADIEAREIVIEGTLDGGLKASESVRLGDASRVQGSVVSPNIAISDGARFRGSVEMVRAGANAASGSRPSQAPATPAKETKETEVARAASATGKANE